MVFFSRRKYKLEIKIPPTIKTEWFDNKVRFIGCKVDIYNFSRELKQLKEFNNSDLIKLGELTLKVSDYLTSDRERKNWIELPNDAWGIMSSKFYDSWEGYDDNPLDFNSCGYTNKNPFDIGIEITDMPLTGLVLAKSYLSLFKSDYNELYIRIENAEVLSYIEDYLMEQKNIKIDSLIDSKIGELKRYILYFDPTDEIELIKAVNELDDKNIEERFNLNNK